MRIDDLMTKDPATCRASDPLSAAAQLMWDRDCGCVPVLADDGSDAVIGVITDRDICMSAHFRGRSPTEIAVAEAMSKSLRTIGPEQTPAEAEEAMRSAKVRRLPVIDAEQRLLGVVSLADLARVAAEQHGWRRAEVSHEEIARTLESIDEAWPAPPIMATA